MLPARVVSPPGISEARHPITPISALGLTAAPRDQGKGSVNQLVVHNF
jgi:hypothetical protein